MSGYQKTSQLCYSSIPCRIPFDRALARAASTHPTVGLSANFRHTTKAALSDRTQNFIHVERRRRTCTLGSCHRNKSPFNRLQTNRFFGAHTTLSIQFIARKGKWSLRQRAPSALQRRLDWALPVMRWRTTECGGLLRSSWRLLRRSALSSGEVRDWNWLFRGCFFLNERAQSAECFSCPARDGAPRRTPLLGAI